MDAEGQNRECDRFTSKGMEKKKQFFLGLFFYCINFVFFIRKSYELKTHLKHWHAML